MSQLLKNKIKESFDRAYKTYDEHCDLQEKISLELKNLLIQQESVFKIIADIACGTGVSTKILTEYLQYETCYAIDFSTNLLSIAKNKFNNNNKIKFILSDFDERLFYDHHLDLIFCNMGLQWSLNLSVTVSIFHAYLKNSGLFVFSMPINDNFPELKKDYKNPTYSVSEIREILENNRFKLKDYHQETYVKEFDTYLDAILSIKSVGANCQLINSASNRAISSRRHLRDVFIDASHVSLSYEIGYFIAEKVV